MVKPISYLGIFLTVLVACDQAPESSPVSITGTGLIHVVQETVPESLPDSLHEAAKANDVEGLEVLWDNDNPLNTLDAEGRTPLHIAIEAKHSEAVEWLLKFGADPYGAQSTLETPLSQAVLIATHCEKRSPAQVQAFDIIALLIEYGANPFEHCKGTRSPLQIAMAHDCEPYIQHILEVVGSKAVRAVGNN